MSEWNTKTAMPDKEVREALELAHKALTEIAKTKGLNPDGERARELCEGALRKLGRVRRIRGF